MQSMPGEKTVFTPNILRHSLFLSAFSEKQLAVIAEGAMPISIQADQAVIRQGEHSAVMYIVIKGRVGVERRDKNGELIKLGELTLHESFGENALLGRDICRATVTALEDSEFLTIDRNHFMEVVRQVSLEEMIDIFSALGAQVQLSSEIEFEQTLTRRTLAAQMEAEKQRALTEMVAGVAHEINTPLSAINAAVSIMARELAAPKEVTTQRAADIAESLELMRRNVERAHRLVQDFKKISVGHLRDEKELFDVAEAVEETVSLVLVNLKRSQIAVNFVNRLTIEQRNWDGYRGVLSQILINLLTNAERHAYPNGIGGDVDVVIELADDNNYRLTVQDYGKGIPMEIQPRIFEPFFTTGRSNGGTGLGLAIVHNLVTNVLKGEVQLRPGLQKGCSFLVTFPRVLPD